MTEAKPGIYPGLSFAEYHMLDAVNHSTLEPFKRTPAHAREAMLHQAEGSEAQATGHAFHEYLLEPLRFAQSYVEAPKVDRRTKAGKATWAEFEAANPTSILLAAGESSEFAAMKASILANETARELLTGKGASEFSIVWPEDDTGLLCKGRLDRVGQLAGYSFIVDLKTCRDASEREFQKDVAKYGYHRQLGSYREGLQVLRPIAEPRRVCFVCVEKEPPYCVAVHELDERALEQGVAEWRRHLKTYKKCTESGEWPGYDAGMSLIDLPPWAVDLGRD